jgi:sarcosine oxidase delta subunit
VNEPRAEEAMKPVMMAVALCVTAWPVFGQQSTTDTSCYVNGRLVNCTSTTKTEPPPSGGALEGINKALAERRAKADANRNQNAQNVQQTPQLSAEAIKELLAEEKQERESKDTVDYIYCRQNPKGSMTDSEGKSKACTEVIEYTKAFCLVNPGVERCTLAKSKAEVDKAFSVLSEDYKTDPRRNKKDAQMYYDSLFAKLTKWGCMSFPDMTLPQRDGTSHPCPNAPEPAPLHADAGSQNK